MRIAYIDHSYHQKTGSTSFFLDFLRELGTVDDYWDDSWIGTNNVSVPEVLSRAYDLTVVFQMEHHVKSLNDSGQRVLFVPMYDSCLTFPESFWRELTDVEILCFCRTLYERLRTWGLHARYAQFFPDPAQFVIDADLRYAGLFWQRRNELQWETLRSLVQDAQLSWINLHQAPDPFSSTINAIPERDQKRYRLRFSVWSEDRSTYNEALRRAGIYFAPRLYEGIGMSFLEAMAMGKAIVAPDHPTMNEYLTHDVNGYLFDPEDPRPIALKRFREIGRMARETIERGHRRWQQSREEIGAWLVSGASSSGLPTRVRRNTASAKISVICLPSSNLTDLKRTCLSVAAQNYSNIEQLVVVGRSQKPGIDSSIRYISVPRGKKRSEIMNIASALARGEWLVFLAAGDTLRDENTLAEALENLSLDTDFVIGHYLNSRADGEQMHWVLDFEVAWERLIAGKLDLSWFARLPTLAATLINRRILKTHTFSRRFQFAADLDLFLRCRRSSASFRHANIPIAKIAGRTRRQLLQKIQECRKIFARETPCAPSVAALCASLRAKECEPLLQSWCQLGPQKLCVNLMRDAGMLQYTADRAFRHICFLGARGMLLRLFLRFRTRHLKKSE